MGASLRSSLCWFDSNRDRHVLVVQRKGHRATNAGMVVRFHPRTPRRRLLAQKRVSYARGSGSIPLDGTMHVALGAARSYKPWSRVRFPGRALLWYVVDAARRRCRGGLITHPNRTRLPGPQPSCSSPKQRQPAQTRFSAGASPASSTSASLAQRKEAAGLNPAQSGFESQAKHFGRVAQLAGGAGLRSPTVRVRISPRPLTLR